MSNFNQYRLSDDPVLLATRQAETDAQRAVDACDQRSGALLIVYSTTLAAHSGNLAHGWSMCCFIATALTMSSIVWRGLNSKTAEDGGIAKAIDGKHQLEQRKMIVTESQSTTAGLRAALRIKSWLQLLGVAIFVLSAMTIARSGLN